MEKTTSLLARTLTAAKRSLDEKKTPVVVFDLDGTLFDNGPRTWFILAEFAEKHRHGALRRAMNKQGPTGLPYLLHDTLALLGVTDEAVVAEARAFWAARFFTHDYQMHDIPLAGARAFVDDLYAMGAHIVYLTGRDVPGMGVGCMRSLHDHGFPVALVRTSMVLKHDFDTPDLDFKTEAVEFISGLGDVVAAFDNEPGNCNLFLRRWPTSISGLLTTQHAPNAPALLDGVVRVADFLE